MNKAIICICGLLNISVIVVTYEIGFRRGLRQGMGTMKKIPNEVTKEKQRTWKDHIQSRFERVE